MGSHIQTLASGTVHIWQIGLSLPEERIQSCRELLSEDEVQRAGRFYFDRDRNHFIAARTAMRSILARYLNLAPREIAFRYGEKGKPELASDLEESGLRFNLSHSHEQAMFAVTRHCSIGVDIEYVNRKFATAEIAERFFSPGEAGTLSRFRAEDQAGAFFSCWTRKEAYIKAVGEGLSLALDSFEVAFGPGVPAKLLRSDHSPHELSRWSMYNLPAPPDYAAALAVEGADHRLDEQKWSWNL
jgi:4'-phosphopantetheinyl transferase